MNWLDLVSYFFGGAFAANAVPHLVSGMMGRAFQTPFASPPGEGLSSSTVNVLWGVCNLGLSYVLLVHVGDFHLGSWLHFAACGAGMLLISVFSAHHFGRFHGGTRSSRA